MKYRDLFELHPIQSVIQLEWADDRAKALQLVRDFVVTPQLADMLSRVALPQMSKRKGLDGKGIFVVGHYGTGKSHVMSYLSALAEHADAPSHVRPGSIGSAALAEFAGTYLVQRCEIAASKMDLYGIVTGQLAALAKKAGVPFVFSAQHEIFNVKHEFARFLAAVQAKHPGKRVLLVIDELLHYLEVRNDQDLVLDFSILQALGEFSDGNDFLFIAGLQRSLFQNTRFNGIASELNRFRQRYADFVIDSQGVEQLVETYLFEKTGDQKARIREVLLAHKDLFENLGPRIDKFTALFPAHPDFLDEFEHVSVVERREILKVLSIEAQALLDLDFDPQRPALITSDRYWSHVAGDHGLDANHAVHRVKANVKALDAKIAEAKLPDEDKALAHRLVHALAVHRLTTPNINDAVGLGAEQLKQRLLPFCALPMRDGKLLTGKVKVLLDRTIDVANGQFLSATPDRSQYYIDPFKITDYPAEVRADSRTTSRQKVEGYFRQLLLKQLELDAEQPVGDGRLWNYRLPWSECNAERPGWLFFGAPGARSTAKPPKDFYLFLLPSPRIQGVAESAFPDSDDEAYFLFEGFPTARREQSDDVLQAAADGEVPETFLDNLWLYAAARERAIIMAKDKDAATALSKIAKEYEDLLSADLAGHIGTWLTVRFRGTTQTLRKWLEQTAPLLLRDPFAKQFRQVASDLMAPHFAEKYPGYPRFAKQVNEAERPQAAAAAIEMLCEVGLGKTGTDQGRSVLAGLGLWKADRFDPTDSPWRALVREKLAALNPGQFVNSGDLFEKREDRDFMVGAPIEAEWLHVVLVAGVRHADLIIVGKANARYDAGDLRKLYDDVRTFREVTKICQPTPFPLEAWRRIFQLLGLNEGLLAHDDNRDKAARALCDDVAKRLQALVELRQRIQGRWPLAAQDGRATAVEPTSLDALKPVLESLQSFTSKARMLTLRMTLPEIEAFGADLGTVAAIQSLADFVRDHQQRLGAVERLLGMLANRALEFEDVAAALRETLRGLYDDPTAFPAEREAARKLLDTACQKGVKAYRDLHKARRLTKEEDKRKQAVIGSRRWRELRVLTGVKLLPAAAYHNLERLADTLKLFRDYADDALLQSPTTTSPHDGFDPRNESSTPAARELDQLETQAASLHASWIDHLLTNLADPSCQESLRALKPDEYTLVRKFRESRELPTHEGDLDRLVQVLNTLFDGLQMRIVDPSEFVATVLDLELPLRVSEVQVRFAGWLKDLVGPDDPSHLRIAVASLAAVPAAERVTETEAA